MAVDAELVSDWLTARSLVRGLPTPIADRGGLRVDVGSDAEISRWVFAAPDAAITTLTRAIHRPGYLVKLARSSDELRPLLASTWRIAEENALMIRDQTGPIISEPPAGYRWLDRSDGAVKHVRVLAADGSLAASGYAARHGDAYIYDRIFTAPDHRRLGLGAALMARLGTGSDDTATEVLTATTAGRALYSSSGWRVASAWTTASVAA